MRDQQPRLNLAARAERWSASHFKKAFFGWLAFAFVVVLLGGAVGTNELADSETASGEAATAQKLLEDGDFESPASEQVLIQSSTLPARDPKFRAVVRDVAARVAELPVVENVVAPLGRRAAGQVSADGRSVLVEFDIRGDADSAEERIQPVLDAVAAAQSEHKGFTIGQFGDASASHEQEQTSEKDTQRAELLTLPVTLLILVLAFGALVAAGLPVLLGLSAVIAATGLSALVSHLVPASDATTSVIVLIGMAVGVDYALFYLRRERQERAAGHSPREALTRTAATSGQAVLISGATVFIAMAGMLFAGNKVFTSIGVGAMIVVAMAMVGSLTVLPAMMAKLGDRVDRGRVPLVSRRANRGGGGRFWGAILGPVLKRPAIAVVVAGGLLVALTIPAFGLHTKVPSFTDLPDDLATVKTYERIQQAFPGSSTPALVVVRARDVNDRRVERAIFDMELRAQGTGRMFQPMQVKRNRSGTVATVSIPLAGSGDDDESTAALTALRDEVIPQTVGRLEGAEVAVTGLTAGTRDFNEAMKSVMPIVFAFVLVLAFLLLLATFRSIVIPLKAIVLNLLSVGSAYGILALVFQNTWAEGLLGFQSNGAITSWLPLFLFVLLFGLSMDYHVFILSRVKELVDRGMSTADAVGEGIRGTAATVTSAALVMVAVFAIFATSAALDMKQMGVGLAAAVVIDATIVRAVLLPASMKLLGDWNWYLPRWLDWLPRLDPEGASLDSRPAGAEARLSLRAERTAEALVVSVSGELDLETAGELTELLEAEEHDVSKVVVDLRRVRFIDSIGLAALVAAHQRARRRGARFVAVRTDKTPVAQILTHTALDQVFDTVERPTA